MAILRSVRDLISPPAVAPDLRVDVTRGEVILHGNFPTARLRRSLMRRVRRLAGSRPVHTDLADDEDLQRQVMGILGDGLTPDRPRPRACVVLGNVFLDWPAGQSDELERLAGALRSIPGIRDVTVMEWARH